MKNGFRGGAIPKIRKKKSGGGGGGGGHVKYFSKTRLETKLLQTFLLL